MAEQHWPRSLWIVRHGESAGNVARDAADAAGLPMVDIVGRDVDVPLSPLGEEQARSLGRWFAALPAGERPNVLLSSPYLRARRTADLICKTGGVEDGCNFTVDERLREKEFGILDRFTTVGIAQRFPDQAEFRRILGKFYHRPPGGESWCDVILRLRSAVDTISLHHQGDRVLIVCHQVIVLCLRYLLECMTEEQILSIDRAAEVANCSVTLYELDDSGAHGKLVLRTCNFVAPLEEEGTPVPVEPDARVAAR